MTDEHRRMHFLYQGKPAMLQHGDRAIMSFDKGTVEFVRHEGRLDIQPRSGRPVSNLDVSHEAGFAVLTMLVDLCSKRLKSDVVAEKSHTVLVIENRVSPSQHGLYLFTAREGTVALNAGDRVIVQSLPTGRSRIEFSRNDVPMLIREELRKENLPNLDIPVYVRLGVMAATVHHCLELFTGLRAERRSPSDNEEIFELVEP